MITKEEWEDANANLLFGLSDEQIEKITRWLEGRDAENN